MKDECRHAGGPFGASWSHVCTGAPASQAVEFSHLLNIGPTLLCPGQGWGNQSLRHWSQPQPTANQLETATFHLGHTPYLDGMVRGLPQSSHPPNTPWHCQLRGMLQGVGGAPSPTPPATPNLCTCLSWGRGKPGTLVAMGMGVGWGVWESKVQNRSHKVGGRSARATPGTCSLFQKSSLQNQSQR